MAINDIDHVFHVIYEKFAENQKDKKYEDRIYIGEDEFIHDLKEFVKKSEVEDKGLLISEIYRSVSEDALEIASDGKITVSPKVLRKVENKIIERKERQEKVNEKYLVQEENKVVDISKLSITDITFEQYQNLNEKEKLDLYTIVFNNNSSKARAVMNLGKIRFSQNEEGNGNVVIDEKDEMPEKESSGSVSSPMDTEIAKMHFETTRKRNDLLEGDFGKIFIKDGKLDEFFMTKVDMIIKNNSDFNLPYVMKLAGKQCKYSDERIIEILKIVKRLHLKNEDLSDLVNLVIQTQEIIDYLDDVKSGSKEISEEEYESACQNVVALEDSYQKLDPLIQLVKNKGNDSEKDKSESIQEVNDDMKKRDEESSKKDNDENRDLNDVEDILIDGAEEVSLDDVQIGEFELDSFSAMFEDIQLEAMDEPVVEDETVDLEPSSAPEVIAENNSAIHAETIDVAQTEEKVVQQVEEQAVEENSRNDIESNLPKELTWVDRAKHGLFKVGKTISNVIKAVTDKNSSKGLFERIADAINSDNNSTSDSSSSSGTSSSAGPSVDEKPIQAPVDYLNTQFKVDVKLAAETAKAASEKQAQRRDASSELTQDEEQL